MKGPNARPHDPRRATPPRRGAAGPLAFLLLAAALVAGGLLAGGPVAGGVLVGVAEERPGMLRNDLVRGIVRDAVGAVADAPAQPKAPNQTFVVQQGDTAGVVARRLADEGVVSRPVVFLLALYETGRESSMQAGAYRVSAAMSPAALADLFQRAVGEQRVLRIIEGWRLSQTAAEVQRRFSKITAEAFTEAAAIGRYDHAFLRDLPQGTLLEGFLFPDTYFFGPDVTAEEIVRTLLDTFQARAGALVSDAARRRGVSEYDLVRVASVVEREARARKESPTIASVYWNRLTIGMKLEADPTVQYALGEWRELTLADLEVDSPYNTYGNPGLPPTPICSPGEAALRGAAEPAVTEYLFFVAKNDGTGEHAFARTVEEHEANRVRYGNR